ncbi:hypothetical protein ABT294_12055 [Nonomuraea sp. NPDC000554]|uniref:hypothetical protein n=1 Tax=Nonomuraea sp. NPDC000554 TaxID=3154259 RepID=UPI0033324156
MASVHGGGQRDPAPAAQQRRADQAGGRDQQDDTGRVTNTVGSPSLNAGARRNCTSISGPSTAPRISGATG